MDEITIETTQVKSPATIRIISNNANGHVDRAICHRNAIELGNFLRAHLPSDTLRVLMETLGGKRNMF